MSARIASRVGRVTLLVGLCSSAWWAGAACDMRGDTQSIVPSGDPEGATSEEDRSARDGAVSAAASTDDDGADPAQASKDASTGTTPAQLSALYDPAVIPEIALTFDAAAMAVLSDPDITRKDTWVHGSFKMGAITFADVGVRRKGTSTFRALPQKASLKIKLNKWVKGQKLNGLTDLTLNNMAGNPSFLAERLGFYVFRSLGLPGQGANTAHVTINGEDYGIYANVETPDEKFLARVFGAKAKTLYEARWCGWWFPDCEPNFDIDVADPNAPPGTKPDLMLLFAAVQAARDESLLADVGARLHTKAWLRHSAVEAVIAHRDGYAYAAYGASHNYFLAGDTDGKFSLVPWSVDLVFSDEHVVTDAAAPLAETLLARCKLGATCWDAYKAEVTSVLAAFEALDLVNLAKKWHAQIDALVLADPKREASVGRYDASKQLLYSWLQARPDVVRAQLGL